MNETTIIAEIGASAVISRNIVQWMKRKGYVTKTWEALLMSYLINFVVIYVLEVARAFATGVPVDMMLAKSLFGMIAAALYHDWNAKNTSIYIQQGTPAPTPPSTPVEQPGQSTVETMPPTDQVVG